MDDGAVSRCIIEQLVCDVQGNRESLVLEVALQLKETHSVVSILVHSNEQALHHLWRDLQRSVPLIQVLGRAHEAHGN